MEGVRYTVVRFDEVEGKQVVATKVHNTPDVEIALSLMDELESNNTSAYTSYNTIVNRGR
jgi:hypothetical protein